MKLKKLFTSMAVTALALGSMFMTAMAEDFTVESTLWITGTGYDATADQTGEGWSWDADTLTLTLDGFEGEDLYLYSDFEDVVNIVVNGENTVSWNSEYNSNWDAITLISASGEFTISGEGTLTIPESGEDAISFSCLDGSEGTGSATISDVTINMEVVNYGFYANALTFDGATVNVDSESMYMFIDGNGVYNSETENYVYGNLEVIDSTFDFVISSLDSPELIDDFETVTFDGSTVDVLVNASADVADTEMYFLYDVGDVIIIESEFNLATDIPDESYLSTYFVIGYNSLEMTESTITCDEWGLLFGYTYDEEGSVTVTDSEITGTIDALAGIFKDFTVENSVLDIETVSSLYVENFNIIDSEVSMVGEMYAIYMVENLNITDSEVYFENVGSTGFQVEEGSYGGFVNYTLTYTTPEYWGLYLDGELSEDYTVESTDIVFGEKILEIRYVHECTFEEYVSDGADTHTATCECGETDTADHTWDDGDVTKEAAVDVAGETTYTCTVCGETKTEAIDALVATPDDAEPEATPEDADPTQPDTGDNGIVALVGLMLLAGAGVAVASKKRA